jgi:hypothetical protein
LDEGSVGDSFRPLRQGELDSLCGVYAVINAVRVLCPEIDRTNATILFHVLMEDLLNDRSDHEAPVVWGVNAALLDNLVLAARDYLRRVLDVRLSRKPLPLPNKRPSLDAVWSSLQDQLQDGRVAIIGLSGDHNHWTVAHAITATRIALVDSGELSVLHRSDCGVKGDAARYRLKVADIIILHRKRPR